MTPFCLCRNEKLREYPRISLMVKSADESEEIAEHADTERKVVVTITLGPTAPLVASIADYGGAGQKFELLVYARSPVTVTPLSGSIEDDHDEAKAIFARYDRNGQGTLTRDEMGVALLELGPVFYDHDKRSKPVAFFR